jgi:hypothetical protein
MRQLDSEATNDLRVDRARIGIRQGHDMRRRRRRDLHAAVSVAVALAVVGEKVLAAASPRSDRFGGVVRHVGFSFGL